MSKQDCKARKEKKTLCGCPESEDSTHAQNVTVVKTKQREPENDPDLASFTIINKNSSKSKKASDRGSCKELTVHKSGASLKKSKGQIPLSLVTDCSGVSTMTVAVADGCNICEKEDKHGKCKTCYRLFQSDDTVGECDECIKFDTPMDGLKCLFNTDNYLEAMQAENIAVKDEDASTGYSTGSLKTNSYKSSSCSTQCSRNSKISKSSKKSEPKKDATKKGSICNISRKGKQNIENKKQSSTNICYYNKNFRINENEENSLDSESYPDDTLLTCEKSVGSFKVTLDASTSYDENDCRNKSYNRSFKNRQIIEKSEQKDHSVPMETDCLCPNNDTKKRQNNLVVYPNQDDESNSTVHPVKDRKNNVCMGRSTTIDSNKENQNNSTIYSNKERHNNTTERQTKSTASLSKERQNNSTKECPNNATVPQIAACSTKSNKENLIDSNTETNNNKLGNANKTSKCVEKCKHKHSENKKKLREETYNPSKTAYVKRNDYNYAINQNPSMNLTSRKYDNLHDIYPTSSRQKYIPQDNIYGNTSMLKATVGTDMYSIIPIPRCNYLQSDNNYIQNTRSYSPYNKEQRTNKFIENSRNRSNFIPSTHLGRNISNTNYAITRQRCGPEKTNIHNTAVWEHANINSENYKENCPGLLRSGILQSSNASPGFNSNDFKYGYGQRMSGVQYPRRDYPVSDDEDDDDELVATQDFDNEYCIGNRVDTIIGNILDRQSQRTEYNNSYNGGQRSINGVYLDKSNSNYGVYRRSNNLPTQTYQAPKGLNILKSIQREYVLPNGRKVLKTEIMSEVDEPDKTRRFRGSYRQYYDDYSTGVDATNFGNTFTQSNQCFDNPRSNANPYYGHMQDWLNIGQDVRQGSSVPVRNTLSVTASKRMILKDYYN